MIVDNKNKEMLLHSAEVLIEENGIDSLSIRKLAQKADVSVGYLYNYFSSKDALLDELMDHFYMKYLHQRICILNNQRPFIDYLEDLFDILKDQTIDPAIHEAIHLRYKDHFSEGLLKVLSQDETIDDSIWGTLSQDALITFLTNHLLFEVSLPQPQFGVMKHMLITTLTKENRK